MLEVEKIEAWRGEDVVDRDGEKVGKLDDVFTDRSSGEPGIVSIKTGFLGRKSILVPLEGASLSRDFLRLDVSKEQIEGAPGGDGGELDQSFATQLFSHYDLDPPARERSEEDGARYESTSVREEKDERARELRLEAAKLKGEAKESDADASEARAKAEKAGEKTASAERDRDEASSEAEALRRKADQLER